ncbi:MAG: hypothetical protein QNJ16_18285, partial [Rhodobacter sp.]|nr:hypothetical protein [Rhodobacter sp.]
LAALSRSLKGKEEAPASPGALKEHTPFMSSSAQGQAQAGQQGLKITADMLRPRKTSLGSGSTTTTRRQGRLTPEEAKRLGGVWDAQVEAARQTKKAGDSVRGMHAKILKDRIDQYQQLGVTSQKEITRIKSELEASAKRFKEIQGRVEKHSVDYDRIWKQPGASRTWATVAIALGAFAQGTAPGSKNSALEIINKAIDRDVAAQKGQLANLIKQSNMSKDRQDRLMKQLLSREKIQRQAYKDMAVVQMEQHRNRMSGVDAKKAIDDLIAGVGEKKIKAEADSRDVVQTTKTSSWRQVMTPGLSGGTIKALREQVGKEPKEKFKNRVADTAKGIRALNEIEGLIRKNGLGRVRQFFDAKQDRARKYIEAVAVALNRANGGVGDVTDKERKNARGVVYSFLGGGKETLTRVSDARNRLKETVTRDIDMREQYGYNVKPLRRLMSGSLARARSPVVRGKVK